MSDNIAHALAGAGGGVIAMAVTYPLVTLSTRLQVRKETAVKQGNMEALRKIIEREGARGLFSGLQSALVGVAVTNGVYVCFRVIISCSVVNLPGRLIYTRNFSHLPSLYLSITGTSLQRRSLGIATVMITNPIWVVNTRMTVKDEEKEEAKVPGALSGTRKREGTLQTVMRTVKEDGLLSFWQGVVPALILVVNPMIQYTAFERIKARLEKIKVLGNLDFFLLGAISKLMATSITYPYIVIKARMQLKQSGDANARYDSVLDGFRKIVRQEGVAGLYKGIGSKLVQSVLTASFLFMAKEALFKRAIFVLAILGARPPKATATR